MEPQPAADSPTQYQMDQGPSPEQSVLLVPTDALAGLAAEVTRLRAQVAELLPWAKAGAGNLVPFGADLTVADGLRLLARIEVGEFGEDRRG